MLCAWARVARLKAMLTSQKRNRGDVKKYPNQLEQFRSSRNISRKQNLTLKQTKTTTKYHKSNTQYTQNTQHTKHKTHNTQHINEVVLKP